MVRVRVFAVLVVPTAREPKVTLEAETVMVGVPLVPESWRVRGELLWLPATLRPSPT